ncbi:MAG TPA: hypothetical protein DIC18_01045 [Clostridiales bacterium]|nr:hypothetical protein [Clostridiales bacterium]
MKKISKKSKIMIILVVLVFASGIAVLSTMAGIGYFEYLSIDRIVSAPDVAADGSITLMSANIRRQEKLFNFKKEDMGSHRWYKRADGYLRNIAAVQPDILGAQEVQPGQYEFLTNHLEGYASVVSYRDKKGDRSESCPIFYSVARFELLESGTFWLSDTPEKMSKFKESDENRIATFVKLRDKTNDMVIAVYNTHPDWASVSARIKQLSVIAQKAQESDADRIVVLGDLNSERKLPGGNEGLAPLDAFLKDSKTFDTIVENNYGDGATFNGYGIDPDAPMGLDYIYVPETTNVIKVGRVDTKYKGVYPSDHYPIYAKVIF